SNSSASRDWTLWTNATNIEFTVDTSTIGNFWYTIEYNNSLGLFGINDTVLINVQDNITPWEGSQPANATYEWNIPAPNITWRLYDNYNYGSYRVLRNTTTILQGLTSWVINGSTVTQAIDTSLPLGVYNYSIEFSDGQGNLALDEVFITIEDTTPPYDNNPFDPPPLPLNTNYDIVWQLYDNLVPGGEGYYRVTSNSTYNGNWIKWVQSTGPTIPVDTTTVGVFSYLITYNDSAGNFNSDEVIVTVVDNVAPWDNDPIDHDVPIGTVETLQWRLFDNYDPGTGAWGYYQVLSNQTGASIIWTAWSANNTLTTPAITINTSSLTVWEYILQYNDSSGNPTSDTVYIRIIEQIPPSIVEIPTADLVPWDGAINISCILFDNHAGGFYRITSISRVGPHGRMVRSLVN
ncbi:MAG: hypothetical protein ACTSRC_09435, partial [Candidatus Helarchaeota archaeon]